jgi:hypothetical protein
VAAEDVLEKLRSKRIISSSHIVRKAFRVESPVKLDVVMRDILTVEKGMKVKRVSCYSKRMDPAQHDNCLEARCASQHDVAHHRLYAIHSTFAINEARA